MARRVPENTPAKKKGKCHQCSFFTGSRARLRSLWSTCPAPGRGNRRCRRAAPHRSRVPHAPVVRNAPRHPFLFTPGPGRLHSFFSFFSRRIFFIFFPRLFFFFFVFLDIIGVFPAFNGRSRLLNYIYIAPLQGRSEVESVAVQEGSNESRIRYFPLQAPTFFFFFFKKIHSFSAPLGGKRFAFPP
jgi:hypothetical protein